MWSEPRTPYGAGAGCARSLILVRPYWSAVAWVTTKPFWSVASAVVQRRETLRLERGAQRVARRHRIIRRLAGAVVDELEGRGGVLGEHVDLTGLEGREDDLAVAELELAFHGRTVALEHLGEDLAQDLLLVEVGRADRDVAFEPGADRVEVLGRDPLGGHVRRRPGVDRDRLVQVGQLLLREALHHRVEQVGDGRVRIQDLLADDRDDVVGELELLVVLEQDEAVRGDRRVRGEQQADVDLAAGQRRTVSGPPASSGTNSANSRPYVSVSPRRQNGRSGHSGGPPSLRVVESAGPAGADGTRPERMGLGRRFAWRARFGRCTGRRR